jgi:hypothetical protein
LLNVGDIKETEAGTRALLPRARSVNPTEARHILNWEAACPTIGSHNGEVVPVLTIA